MRRCQEEGKQTNGCRNETRNELSGGGGALWNERDGERGPGERVRPPARGSNPAAANQARATSLPIPSKRDEPKHKYMLQMLQLW